MIANFPGLRTWRHLSGSYTVWGSSGAQCYPPPTSSWAHCSEGDRSQQPSQGANVRNATSNMGGQSGSQGGGGAAGGQAINQPPTFQRLKVEDALSHLDQVKFKFGNQPIES